MATRRRTTRTAPGTGVTQSPEELSKVIAEIRKRYGDNTMIMGSQQKQPFRIPTGIFTYDYATLGGIPHNRITMFHGPKHSGKTTAAERCIVGAQRSMPDQQAVFVDIEGTRDATWGAKIGVNNDTLNIVQPDSGEQAVDMTDALVQTREVSLIVIDSLAALLPIKEAEASAEDSLVAQQSRLITSMLRKISAGMIKERKRGHFVSVLLINQQRTKIGGWSPTGEPLSLPGGKALGFFTSLETAWKNKENIGKDAEGFDVLTHNEHAFQIQKNKMNGGMRSGEFRMLRMDDAKTGLAEAAVDDASTLIAFAKKLGWYSGAGKGQRLQYEDVDMKFGKVEEAIDWLYEDFEEYWKLRTFLIAENAKRMAMPQEFVDYLLTGYI